MPKGALSGRSAKKILDDFSVAPTGGDSLPIAKDQHLVALIERLGGPDVRGVDDYRTVYAKKRVRRQPGLEMAERLADVVR